MTRPSKTFRPPEPVGEPFRADPSSPPPFPTDRRAPVPSVIMPPVLGEPPASAYVRPGADGSRSGQPVFQPKPSRDLSNDERFARRALGVSIASIFFFGIVLGPLGIVLGAVSIKRGQKKLGGWAVATGVGGTVTAILILVLVATGAIPSIGEMFNGTGS